MDGQNWYSNIGGFFMRSILFRVIVFGVLGVAGYSQVSESSKDDSTRDDSGEIVAAGDVGVLVLKVGDCVQVPSELKSQLWSDTTELTIVTSFSAVPCTELHDAELFSEKKVNLNEFPGEDALIDGYSDFCVEDYATYSGTDFESSPHLYFPMVPTAVSWEQGDRAIQCFAVMENGEQLGASIKN